MKRDDVDLAPPRKSIMSLVVPAGSVAIVVVNSLFVGLAFGRKDEQLANVVDAVKEIKTEMYRRSDAEALNLKVEFLDRRVTALEAVRQHHVDVVTAKVEKQEDDILTRAQHWLTGGGKK